MKKSFIVTLLLSLQMYMNPLHAEGGLSVFAVCLALVIIASILYFAVIRTLVN